MEEVILLQDYLRIDTTPQTGSELAGAQYLASLLEREGIETEVIDMGGRKANSGRGAAGGQRPRRWSSTTTSTSTRSSTPEKWAHPPFSGTIDPPWIYGRGAFDMKSVAIAQLHATDRAQAQRRRAATLGGVPRHQRRGDRQHRGHRVAPARARRSCWARAGRPHRGRRGGGAHAATTSSTGERRTRRSATSASSPAAGRAIACETLHADLRAESDPLDHLRVLPRGRGVPALPTRPSRDRPTHRELLSRSGVDDRRPRPLRRSSPDYLKVSFATRSGRSAWSRQPMAAAGSCPSRSVFCPTPTSTRRSTGCSRRG